MQIIPLPRVIGFLAACLSTQLWLSAAHAHLAVQIRGSAQLDADVDLAAAASEEVAIRGRLRDELGQSIAGAKIRLKPTRDQSSVRAKDCGSRTTAATTDIETDAEGHFCARLARNELAGGSPLRVTFDGSETYGSAITTVALEDSRAGLSVDFGQLSHVVNLDANELDFVVELHPIVPAALRDSLPLSIELALRANDSGKFDERALQRQQAKVSTPIHFAVPSRQLGRPGIGELVLAFDGNPSYKPFRSLHRIERTTSVRLTVSDWPESGVQGDRISVVARAISGTNLPPPGFVELIGFDESPKLLDLQRDGTVSLVIQIPRHPRTDFVSLRYQSISAGWRPESPLRLTLHLVPESRWSLVGWVGAALLVLAWFAWSTRRAEPGAARASASPTPRPYAHLEIIEASKDPNAGWSGTVVDAHEGLAIAGAHVELCRPGFDRQEQLYMTHSDDLGRFEIPHQPVETDVACRLEIKASGFARLGLTLPSPGRIKVHLVSVRRAVLDRLVAWAKRRGQPFDSKAEPTPDWVAEVARSKGHPAIEAWAKSVSVAAFGKDGPDNPERDDLLPPPGRVGSLAEAKRKEP